LHEAVPGVSRLAILANVRSPAVLLDMREVQAAAGTLGMEVVSLELRRQDEIEPVFETLGGRADALYVVNDPLVDSNRDRINTAALAAHLPTMYGSREHAEAGGLMSYGADFADMFRRAAALVDKVLKGAAPATLPVEQPTKFELVLNLKTAKALNLTIPPTLLGPRR
jgi:putative tryptophan/tyrosine transport system substrate-binding protein